MTLAQYLAAGEPSAQEEEHELKAVDMRDFGFAGVGEMMDLVCAVWLGSSLASHRTLRTDFSLPLCHVLPSLHPPPDALYVDSAVRNEFIHALYAIFDTYRRVHIPAHRIDKSFVYAECGRGVSFWIVTSYIDVSLPRHMRQKDLMERYHFTCSCSLCERYAPRTTETGKRKARVVDPRWCMFHPACDKNGVLALPSLSTCETGDLVCSACGKAAQVQLEKVNALVALGTQIVQADERGQLSVDEAKDIPALAEKLSTLLPATSYPLLPLLRLYALQLTQPDSSTAVVQTSSASVEQGLGHNLFPAIRIHSILVHALGPVLPANHPSLGIALAELGKLLNVHVDESALSTPGGSQVDLGNGFLIPRATSKRLPLTLSTLRRAWEALQVGFGRENGVEGGVVAWEIKVLIDGLEREMQMRRGV
ncbi:hypothetical protein QFC22_004278 [Naganishia vaughanmartiniae]|uniref:Uncharacterized protein n=1 Tax=Naganishia vaughanmartiniae TaxID=1424756 RepID=A0ACC2X084_9TREE|nr:hypothetical protein QFC22_004278 [Naganishia vaughanmartiniae]